MKKTKITCFLALLCLFGSEIYGQVASPPTTTGSENVSAPVVVYFEVNSPVPIDTFTVSFNAHYLDDFTRLPEPENTELASKRGSVYGGNASMEYFTYQSPRFSDTGYLTIKGGKGTFLERVQISPGDSVAISVDLENGNTVFSGPDAMKYRCQHELRLAHRAFMEQVPPVMYTGDTAVHFNEGNNREEYKKALANAPSMQPPMQVVAYGDGSIPYIRSVLNLEVKDHPGYQVLRAYAAVLDRDFMVSMEKELEGMAYGEKVQAFMRSFRHTDAFRKLYNETISSLPLDREDDVLRHSAHYLDYLFDRCTLRAILEGVPIYEVYGEYSPKVRDQLIGKYLVKFYRQLPSPEEKFTQGLATVKTPWVLETISGLYQTQKVGAPFLETEFTGTDGKTVPSNTFKGKVVLLDFWFTGCSASSKMHHNYLQPTIDAIGDAGNFELVSISRDRDKDKWLNSIREGKYTSEAYTNLWTGGPDHKVLDYYNIHAFPTLMLLDREGKIRKVGNFPDDPQELAGLIQELIEEPHQSTTP
ncbi:redoxin family protein [Echinicola sp. CAU 1574]|uniref:Redoxin family protein n=1 Tax=Echinicola arenosa TaxID=2774144 RepID=A0ABR9AK86_9BACT|nr:TlpA disulfide reductase family protein [Echinicola arenosa]MBD8489181.1 redoxin family protein [Echinicola arenosa]